MTNTIDWTKAVETDEDPPRPVRVLTQFDWNGDDCTLVEMPNGMAMAFTDEGVNKAAGVSLRNAPEPKPEKSCVTCGRNQGNGACLRGAGMLGPCGNGVLDHQYWIAKAEAKPEPVLLEAWVNLYESGDTDGPWPEKDIAETMFEPCERLVECRRIAWMSDGSAVPDICAHCGGRHAPDCDVTTPWRERADAAEGTAKHLLEMTAERDKWKARAKRLGADTYDFLDEARDNQNVGEELVASLTADRDHWKAEVEALAQIRLAWEDRALTAEAQIAAMEPVVDAAMAWNGAGTLVLRSPQEGSLFEAVRAYQAAQSSNCETNDAGTPNPAEMSLITDISDAVTVEGKGCTNCAWNGSRSVCGELDCLGVSNGYRGWEKADD